MSVLEFSNTTFASQVKLAHREQVDLQIELDDLMEVRIVFFNCLKIECLLTQVKRAPFCLAHPSLSICSALFALVTIPHLVKSL